jgi:hypothetical protein
LAKTTFYRGETIKGELTIQNSSNQPVHIWDGYWPVGLLRGGVLVGGFDNTAGHATGYAEYSLSPGQTKHYPPPGDYGGFYGSLDTLSCHRREGERRWPLPSGEYQLIVSFPIGDPLRPVWDQGAQARVDIRIVP